MSFFPFIVQCVFPKNRNILILNQSPFIKIRKIILIEFFCCLNHTFHLNLASCFSNVLCKSRIQLGLLVSYHCQCVFSFFLNEFLILILNDSDIFLRIQASCFAECHSVWIYLMFCHDQIPALHFSMNTVEIVECS